MPNISSCDPKWNRRQIDEQKEIVVVAWSESLNMNEVTEGLAKLEDQGIPVSVIDCDSCVQVPDSLGMKPGEIAVFKSGKEVGKIISTSDAVNDIAQIKNIAGR